MAVEQQDLDIILRFRAEAAQAFRAAGVVLDSVGKAGERAGRGTKQAGDSAKNTGLAFRNLATSAAVLQGPLGPVAGRLSAIGAALNAVNPAMLAFGVASAGAIAILNKAVRTTAEVERQQLRLAALVRATGEAAGLSAEQLDRLARDVARSTLASTAGVRDAIGVMLTFRSVTGDTFKRAVVLSADLAEVFEGSVKDAALSLAKALENPERGITSLERKGILFTQTQKEMVKQLVESGQGLKAQAVILDVVAERFEGVGAAAGAGLLGILDELSQNFTEFLETVGNSGPLESAEFVFRSLRDAVKGADDALKEMGPEVREAIASMLALAPVVLGASIAVKALWLILRALGGPLILASTAILTITPLIVGWTTENRRLAKSAEDIGKSLEQQRKAMRGVTGEARELLFRQQELRLSTDIQARLAQEELLKAEIKAAVAERESLQQRGGLVSGRLDAVNRTIANKTRELAANLNSLAGLMGQFKDLRKSVEKDTAPLVPRPAPLELRQETDSSKFLRTRAEEIERIREELFLLRGSNDARRDELRLIKLRQEAQNTKGLNQQTATRVLAELEDALRERRIEQEELKYAQELASDQDQFNTFVRDTVDALQDQIIMLKLSSKEADEYRVTVDATRKAQELGIQNYDEYVRQILNLHREMVRTQESVLTFQRGVDRVIEKAHRTAIDDAQFTEDLLTDTASNVGNLIDGMFTRQIKSWDDFRSALAGILSQMAADLAKFAALKVFDASSRDGNGGFLKSVLGFLLPATTGGAAGATEFARGAAFLNGRVTAMAHGGILNGPTLFPHGGGLGLAGEAGSEAVLPLARLPSGDLGVKSAGAGGTFVYSPTFSITMPGGGGGGGSADNSKALAKNLDRAVRATVEEVLAENARPGGMLRSFGAS